MNKLMHPKKFSIPAIILGMSVNGLGVARSLGLAGVSAIGLDSDKKNTGMRTRFAKCFCCPSSLEEPAACEEYLLNIIKGIEGDIVVLPTSDNFVAFLNDFRNRLPPRVKFILPDQNLMERLLDKASQYDLARAYGIAVPRSCLVSNLKELEDESCNFEYPVIMKGATTGHWRKKFEDQKVVLSKDRSELLHNYRNLSSAILSSVVVQEVVSGGDDQIYQFIAFLNQESSLVCEFMYRKIRQYPCHFGVGSAVESTWHPELAEIASNFLQNIKYKGPVSVEFKYDNRDKKFKLIEMNLRFCAQNWLADRCGLNFPLAVYKVLIGQEVKKTSNFLRGVKWICFAPDRASYYGYLREGKITLGKWLKSLVQPKVVWAIWYFRDPLPFLFEIKFGFAIVFKVVRRVIRIFKRREQFAMMQDKSF